MSWTNNWIHWFWIHKNKSLSQFGCGGGGWVVGFGVSWILTSALVLFSLILRPVLETSLGQWPGPGPKLDNTSRLHIIIICNIDGVGRVNCNLHTVLYVWLYWNWKCIWKHFFNVFNNKFIFEVSTYAQLCFQNDYFILRRSSFDFDSNLLHLRVDWDDQDPSLS